MLRVSPESFKMMEFVSSGAAASEQLNPKNKNQFRNSVKSRTSKVKVKVSFQFSYFLFSM